MRRALTGPLSFGLSKAIASPEGGGGWSPLSLGASLYDMWDAELGATIDLSGAAVTAWRSAKNAYSAAQAVGAARPVYSATSFNGRPGVTLDGSDDELTYAGVGVFPVGTTECEIWTLLDQTALAADSTVRALFSYGGNTAASRRTMQRGVSAGANVAQARIGNGSSSVTPSGTGDYSGRHVVRAVSSLTDIRVDVDGVVGSASAVVPSIGSTRTRIGALNSDTAASFCQGVLSLVAVTAPLTTDEAAQMLTYLKTRGGIA